MTKISDIRAGMRRIDAEGTVIEVGASRTVNLKAGGTNTVADVTITDGSANIKLSLWGADIGKFGILGKRLKVSNGYVNTFKGENTLAVGKFGKLEVL